MSMSNRFVIPEKECPKCHGHAWYCNLQKISLGKHKSSGTEEFKLKKIPVICAVCSEGGGVGGLSSLNVKNYESMLGDGSKQVLPSGP